MSTARDYGGWDVLEARLGPIHARYQRVAGRAEELAGFTEDGVRVTQFDSLGLIEKQELLPWAKSKMDEMAKRAKETL